MKTESRLLYTARTHSKGGRERGVARSADGMLDLRLANPGSGRIGTNPEQLLAAGWSASFESALAIAARERGIALPADLNIETAVSLELADDGYFISVEFHIRLKDVDPKIAKTLVDLSVLEGDKRQYFCCDECALIGDLRRVSAPGA